MSVQSTIPYTVNLSPAKNCEKVALILTYEWKKMGKEEKKGKIKKTTKYQPFRILKLQALENTLICSNENFCREKLKSIGFLP